MVSMKANERASRMTIRMALMCLLFLSPLNSFAADTGSGACAPDSSMDKSVESQAQSAAASLKVTGQVKAWIEARESCKKDNLAGQKECFEACSKSAQSGLGGAAALGAAMNIVSGLMNKTCGQQQQAAQQMKQGYDGYSKACKAAQATCLGSCGKALKAGEALQTAAQAAVASCSPTEMPKCSADAATIAKAVGQDKSTGSSFAGGKNDQCNREFSNNLAKAAELLNGIAGMLNGAKQCADEAKDTVNPDASADLTLDCTLVQNKDNQKCICEANPRLLGCDNGLAKPGDLTTPNFAANEVPDLPTKDPGDATLGAPNAEPILPTPGDGSLNSAGQLAGGGGGMAGAAGAGGGPEGKDGAGKSGLSSNIFGGEAGGGGGGGSGWSAGSSKKDAKGRGLAGAGTAKAASQYTNQVTGPGGRSNWDKVKERYKDNRPTFLND